MPLSRSNLSPTPLVLLAPDGHGPLHERLTRQLRSAIRTGRLPLGAALPPSRELARELGLSRWTVTEAYSLLAAEGYVAARAGSGTRVCWVAPDASTSPEVVSQPAPPPRIDLRPGLPDLRSFPRRRWVEALRQQASAAALADFGPPDAAGHVLLRARAGAYLERGRNASQTGAGLIVTTGSRSGLERICRALQGAGVGHLAAEDPGWTRMHDVVRATGMGLVPVPVDGDGIVVDALDDHPEVRAVLVTPAHQFPTGVAMAPGRRSRLLDWAERVDGVIIEDDYDAEFRYDHAPVASLQGMSPRRVVLLGSLSKTLSPALGVGWMLAPARWAGEVLRADVATPVPPVLDQLTFAAFLDSGAYDRHLRAARRRYRSRRDALVAALERELPAGRLSGLPAGLHLILRLPDDLDAAEVVRVAATGGLRVTDARRYDMAPRNGTSALVIGYGNLADASVDIAARSLAAAVREVMSSMRA